jgi:hypothetical protein
VFEDNTDEYRAWAAQCRTMAARAKSDEDGQAWLELAEKWRRLANELSPRNRVRLSSGATASPSKICRENMSGKP